MYRNLLFGHAAAATALRASDTEDADGDGEAVSIYAVTAAWPVWPADPTSAADLAAAERYDWAYNMAFPHALVTGELDLDLDGDFDGTESGEAEGYVPELANTLDVIGLNYYSRTFVVALEASPLGGIPCLAGIVCGTPGPVAGDNGSEVYPEGLYDVISTFSSLGLPLFITENGVADDDDDLRPAFLATHLREAARAIADGYPLGGYLHWSLLDNYEWRHGFAMKFGLYEVDLETMARRPRPDSVAVFREIVETNSVTTEMLDSWPLPEHH
jgi:beta-galactosidase